MSSVMRKRLDLGPLCRQIYTVWNFRREALGPVLAAGGEAAARACEGELALTQAGDWGCTDVTG